jgi:hypothetical protein
MGPAVSACAGCRRAGRSPVLRRRRHDPPDCSTTRGRLGGLGRRTRCEQARSRRSRPCSCCLLASGSGAARSAFVALLGAKRVLGSVRAPLAVVDDARHAKFRAPAPSSHDVTEDVMQLQFRIGVGTCADWMATSAARGSIAGARGCASKRRAGRKGAVAASTAQRRRPAPLRLEATKIA